MYAKDIKKNLMISKTQMMPKSRSIDLTATLLLSLIATLLFVACSSGSDTFRLEGRLRNINQGEFYIYNLGGGPIGIDTIQVRSGRFAYELEMTEKATLVLVFPNFSEQPVFAGPGETVTIKGDASHMKEMIIEGTRENEDMTSLRMELNDLTPPDIPKAVSDFIHEHPESQASVYALLRYFLNLINPDYQQALQLVKVMEKEQPDNAALQKLSRDLQHLQGAKVGSTLPQFKAKDINGNLVTEQALKHEINVVAVWASWSWLSTQQMQQLRKLSKNYGDRMGVVAICVDGKLFDCQRIVRRDSLSWPTVCDGKMWETPLLSTFALSDVPTYILIDNKGRILAHNLPYQLLEQRIKQTYKL
jgi:hypothetical protein